MHSGKKPQIEQDLLNGKYINHLFDWLNRYDFDVRASLRILQSSAEFAKRSPRMSPTLLSPLYSPHSLFFFAFLVEVIQREIANNPQHISELLHLSFQFSTQPLILQKTISLLHCIIKDLQDHSPK
jgi:hypothetical protein